MQICLIKWQNLGCDTQINLQTTKKEYYLRVVKKKPISIFHGNDC